MKWGNMIFRLGLGSFLIFMAIQEMGREHIGWATFYLVLGVLNLLFVLDGD